MRPFAFRYIKCCYLQNQSQQRHLFYPGNQFIIHSIGITLSLRKQPLIRTSKIRLREKNSTSKTKKGCWNLCVNFF